MKKSIFKAKLKEVLRPMVLQEITAEPLSPTQRNKKPTELVDKLEKLAGSDAEVEFQPVSGKVVIECDKSGKKYRIEISENGCDCYTVVAILDGSERLSLKTAKFEQIEKLIKETIKGRKEGDSYTGKAYKKNSIPEKKEKVEEKSDTDEDKSEETEKLKFKKQIDHKPLEPKDRDIEEVTKGTTGMTDSTKFKKLVDIKGTDKVKLKADKKNASDEKLVQKMDGTSKMKALKESMNRSVKRLLKESVSSKADNVYAALAKKFPENAEDAYSFASIMWMIWAYFTEEGKSEVTEKPTKEELFNLKSYMSQIYDARNLRGFTSEFGIRDAVSKIGSIRGLKVNETQHSASTNNKLKESIKKVIKEVLKESIKKLTPAQKKAINVYNMAVADEDRYLGSVFANPVGQRNKEAKTKAAYEACKALGMTHEHGL